MLGRNLRVIRQNDKFTGTEFVPFKPMIEELKDERLINKVGGRFKLSALIQKRLVALNKGSRSPMDGSGKDGNSAKDKLSVVIREILQDKVYLDLEEKRHTDHEGGVDMVLDSEFTDGY